MKTLVLACLALLCTATLSQGGPNAGGVVLLHWNSALLNYTGDPAYIEGGLTSCEAAVPQAPPAVNFPPPWSERRLWFAYAAFPPGASPRLKAVEFGVTYTQFETPVGVKIDWIATPPGTTEAPTVIPTWPLPNSGNALVFATTRTDLVDQMLTFAGYGSQGQIIALRTHPSSPSTFADDGVPANLDPIAAFGSMGFGVNGQLPCPCNPCPGACCFTNCTCQVLTSADCAAAGGLWMGPDTNCTPNPCSCPPGACCFPDGSCQILPLGLCVASGGEPLGAGTVCSPNPCPPAGACCFADCSCRVLTSEACQNLGGIWMGAGTNCAPSPCSCPFGACCLPDGTCLFVMQGNCPTGDWRMGLPCDPNPCIVHTGACCLPDCSCEVMTSAACVDSGGVWAGPDVPCDPNPCSCPPGACCYPDGSCQFVTQADCPTGDWRPGVPCDPNPCLPTGACCFDTGECRILSRLECEAAGGTYIGDHVPCTPQLCAPVPIERSSWGRIKSYYR